MFYTTWRKAIRRLFGLPRNAHCNILPLVAACLPIQSQLLNRCANFVNSCLNSNNSILKLLSSLALQGSGSQMANTSYYGSCLWNLQHKLVDVFYTTWRKAIRRLFGLPRNAHCNILPLVAACLPIQSQLLNRCANFVNSCLNSNNSILKLLSSLALQGSGSQMANNCNLIKFVYRIDSNDIICHRQ